MRSRPFRVLIIDDSAAVRAAMSEIVNADPDLEVMATANDPVQAVQRLQQERPDVITLDVEMPKMDGLTFLRRIMSQHPIPVVMCSTLMEKDSDALLEALRTGAVDVIQKPKLGAAGFLGESCREVCSVIKTAAEARLKPRATRIKIEQKLTADEVLPPPSKTRRNTGIAPTLIAVGASTGGTEALHELLVGIPVDCPPIVVVQHMPKTFTGAFADTLNKATSIEVREAKDGDMLQSGTALISPGGVHSLVVRRGSNYFVELRDGPLVSRHRPSVDVMFRSVARAAGSGAIGVILTGMGDDGARGLREMRDHGAATIGQDESSCVVYGMPKAAYDNGAVQVQLPLENIARRIVTQAAA